jgi:NOL1/NOP2/fmu family ribosome biogenesis protein
MNVSHLQIKFGAIEKHRLRLHFQCELADRAPKQSVGTPEITPEPGSWQIGGRAG